jgi:lipopolysaccharide transport system permease protein
MSYNPMFPIVSAYHDILVYAKSPDIQLIATVSAVAMVLLLLSLFMFRRASAEMVDAL